ncbi:MAG TPA: hypothetical protein VHE81_10755 [Lacipirellulaceae bacterium]|nr:hypothetical protein [Lacipirellulaceae bacterium]
MRLISRQLKLFVSLMAIVGVYVLCRELPAQDEGSTHGRAKLDPAQISSAASDRQAPHRIATIHWQRVPLREALGRLQPVFGETVFADRRVDPQLRVTLDIEAGSAEDVVAAIAAQHHLGVGRLGSLVYLGPSGAAERLPAVAAARSREVARLPGGLRATFTRKQAVSWPRLTEPRGFIASSVEQRGWRIVNAEKIPFDLWAAGQLPELSLSQQLTVLLNGFDLTFELQSSDRTIRVVGLKDIPALPANSMAKSRRSAQTKMVGSRPGTRQVYTLRVQEQPVRLVLRALSQRLHWAIQIDESQIQAAGKSLDTRVSFSVQDADRDHLLDALLKPAGLDYRLEDDRVRIIARRYSD